MKRLVIVCVIAVAGCSTQSVAPVRGGTASNNNPVVVSPPQSRCPGRTGCEPLAHTPERYDPGDRLVPRSGVVFGTTKRMQVMRRYGR